MDQIKSGNDFISFDFGGGESEVEADEVDIDVDLDDDSPAFLSVDPLTALPMPCWTPHSRDYSANFVTLYLS